MNQSTPIKDEKFKKILLYSMIGFSIFLMVIAFIVYQASSQKKDQTPAVSTIHTYWINDFNKGKEPSLIKMGDQILELGIRLKDGDLDAQVICRPFVPPKP